MIGTGVPFADDARVPAIRPQILQPVGALLRIADVVWIARGQMHAGDAVLIQAGEIGGAGGRAPGTGIAMGKAQPFAGEAVDVWRIHPGMRSWITAHGAKALVIGKDIENVPRAGGWSLMLGHCCKLHDATFLLTISVSGTSRHK